MSEVEEVIVERSEDGDLTEVRRNVLHFAYDFILSFPLYILVQHEQGWSPE